jgi:hypothetical protein
MLIKTAWAIKYCFTLIRYSRACGSYQDFLDRGLLLTMKLLNKGFLLVKLKSSLRKCISKNWQQKNAKRKSKKGQTTIGKTYISNKRSSNTNPTQNRGFLVKLKSSLRKLLGRHHDLVDRVGVSVSQMTTDMFMKWKVWDLDFRRTNKNMICDTPSNSS